GRGSDEVLRSGPEPQHDAARDHDPPDLLLREDVQEAAARSAGGDYQGRQGSRHLWPPDRIGRRPEETRGNAGGRQAQDDPVRGPRADEEARRSGDGRVREGNRRRSDLQQDQLDVGIVGGSGGGDASAGLFLPPRGRVTGTRMRKFMDGYYRLLNVLL